MNNIDFLLQGFSLGLIVGYIFHCLIMKRYEKHIEGLHRTIEYLGFDR